ncbi:MAG: DUF2950 domain-containing protein [Gammaproteobacteria bacterium]
MNTANSFRKAGVAVVLVAAALVSGCAPKPEAHTSFATADEAVTALVAALEKGEVPTLGKLLGPGSEDLVSSGDPVADKSDRDSFVASYREKHELVADGDSKRVLQVGAQDWPVPVPVVLRGGRWYLDGAAGADEIIYRRIGSNELGAIAVARGFVEAQLDYATAARDGNPAGVYAQKLLSDADRQNGLYWPTADDEPPSPAGPFVALAGSEGYRAGAEGQRVPYHGYYYRSLYGQGPSANGGAFPYFTDGLLTQGFALIAWPADYGASGVMTFVVNQDGVVFEKDLGEDTATVVETIQDFDPDASWTPLDDGGAG